MTSSKHRGRRATALSWCLSLLINLLILCLLAWLPLHVRIRSDSALHVELIRAAETSPKPRVSPRQRIASSSSPRSVAPADKMRPLRAGSSPQAVPVTTAARLPRPSPEAALLVSAQTLLPEHLHAQPGASLPKVPVTSLTGRERAAAPSPGLSRRQGGWLQRLREEPGKVYAQISGLGREITGTYDIACVQHEDTADMMRTEALAHLVLAMNRWTNVRTRLLPGSFTLDDPQIQSLPLVYLAAHGAFALSEKERANLRRYLLQGGTLLFSDFSTEWGDGGPTANSIHFEIWKILGESGTFRPISSDTPVSHSFFEFHKLPLVDADRGGFYGIWLDGRIAVFYDAAGFGWQWRTTPEDERSLQWGVNLLVYALERRAMSLNP